MNGIQRTITALAALALAVVGVMLALGTLPSRVEAQETGRLVPWILCWALAWIAALSAVAVAGFLLAPPRRTR
jgi:cytochrome c oxidase assembly factor CtaG